jgi:predicted  nucleic acid-binding Zn-ribbon protein
MRRHALLIIACPRSGATALAGALAHAGATPGRTFVAAPPGEAAATWQCAPLVALNDRLLAAMGLRWDSLVAPPERWRERAGVRALIAEADALIASEYGNATHALFHDPRLSLTAPFWRERLEAADFDACAAIVVRRPIEVAASLSKREPFAPEKTLALWLHYLGEGERGTRGIPRTLVTFDRLLDAPAGVLSHVVSECRYGLKIERAEREAALTAIRPDLKHFGDERQLSAGALSSGIDTALDEGYRRLAMLSPGTDPKRTIEALAQDAYASLTQAIPPWLAQELANDRVHAERQADVLADTRQQLEALEASLAQTRRAHQTRDRDEAAMRDRIDSLSRTGNSEGRDARMDEALAQLRSDVGRIAYTLSDQPAREQALRLELVQAQRDLEDERTTISRLSESLEHERAAGEAQAAKLALAQSHLQALVAEVEQARAAEHAWTEHNAALARDLDEVRNALHSMQSERDALRKERDEATRQLERLKGDLESARTDLKILDNDRTALAARAQAVDHAAAGLRDELGRRAVSETALTGERDRLAAEIRNQADRLSTLERELARRMAELTALSGRHETMKSTLARLERSWLGRKVLAGKRRSPA